MTDILRYPFTDPIHRWAEVALLVDPAARAWDALAVEHPKCDSHATVSADLDAFYCSACGWNGRISGAWAYDMWYQAQPEEDRRRWEAEARQHEADEEMAYFDGGDPSA